MNVSIIIPAYNEEENIPKLLDSLLNLKSSLKDFEIIIVNDNSNDSTGLISEKYSKKNKIVKVVHRNKGNNGMGASLKEGTRHAKGKYVVWVMADNSDDLTIIPKLINKLKNSYDMVFGSRYMSGGSRGDLDIFKTALSSGYTFIAGILFNFKVHDITNAFRAFKKDVFSNIALESDNFAISPEFAIKAHLKGYKLGEVPTTHKNRKAGQAKFKIAKMGIAYISLFKYRFMNYDKTPKIKIIKIYSII